MAKGSGGTRSTRGKSDNTPTAIQNAKYLKANFKDAGGGNLLLDTPIGGGQILVNTDEFNKYRYGTKTVYEAVPWDKDSTMGEKKIFSSLENAKKYAKSKMTT